MFAFVFLFLSVTQAVTRGETITPVYVNDFDPGALTCPAGDQATTLTWTGPGGILYVTGVRVETDLRYTVKWRISASHSGGNYTLRFTDFRNMDTGIYTCIVDGTVNIQMVVVQHRSSVKVYTRLGWTVTLQSPHTGGSVYWTASPFDVPYTNRTQILSNIPDATRTRLKVTRRGGNWDLQISDVQLSDVREYKGYTRVSVFRSFYLLLSFPPDFPEIENTVIVNGHNRTTGTEDRSMTLTCHSLGGTPAASVSWIKDGTTLVTSDNTTQYTKVFSRTDDRTVYKCQSSSPALPSPQTNSVLVYLDLKPGQPIISGQLSQTENNNQQLVCKSTGSRPAAMIQWNIGGTWHSNNPKEVKVKDSVTDTYTVTSRLSIPVTRQDNGKSVYCRASNQALSGGIESVPRSITVLYPPDIRVTYTNTTFTSPDRTFTCVPDGNPDTYQFGDWRHTSEDGTEIRQLTGSSRPTQSDLTLPDPGVTRRYEDTGYYICKVSNDIPDSSTYSSSSVFFVVEAPPVVDIPANTASVHGQIGKDIIITVEFYSRPAVSSSDVTWTRESKELLTRDTFVTSLGTRTIIMPFHGVNVHVKGYVAVLIINDLATEDLGDYRVTIENRVGIEHYTVSIISTGGDKLVSERTALIIASSIFSVVIITMVVIFIIFRVRQGRTNKRTNPETETNQRSGPDNSDSNENNQQSGYDDLNIVNISPPSVYEDIQNRGDSNASNQQSRYEDLNLVNVSPPSVYEDIQNRGDSNENNQQSGYEDLNLVNISPPSVYEDIQNRGDSNENNQQSGYEDMNLVNIRPPSVYEDIQNRE